MTGVKPPCNREKLDWRPYGDPARGTAGVTGRGKILKSTGGVTTVMAGLSQTRSGTVPPV